MNVSDPKAPDPVAPVDAPSPDDDLAIVKARCAVLKLRVGRLEHQLAAVLAWPAYRQWRREQEARARAAEADRREADRKGWMAARVKDLLREGFLLLSGSLAGDGEKLTPAGDLIRFGSNSTGYYEVEVEPADETERQRRRLKFYRVTLQRAEAAGMVERLHRLYVRSLRALQDQRRL
jgi:hypothetical protein